MSPAFIVLPKFGVTYDIFLGGCPLQIELIRHIENAGFA
jgi:hypothetical protein